MKAVVIRGFGPPDVLAQENDYPMPEPLSNQVLIKVTASGVNPLDLKIRKGMLRFIAPSKFPVILGNDASGVIVKSGSDVRDFIVGDQVYCMVDSNKRFASSGFAKGGSYAEYCVTREDTLSLKPGTISSEEAAAVPLSCLTAYQALVHQARIDNRSKVLINGASGGVGVYAVQIAKAHHAEVTAVCSSRNTDLMRELGADDVIDYREQEFCRLPDQFDLVYDVAATATYWKCKSILKKNGLYISNVAKPMNIITTYLFPILGIFGFEKRSTFAWVKPSGKDLAAITGMIEAGKIRPIIDKVFSLDEIKDAHQYLESGMAKGKIIIKMQ